MNTTIRIPVSKTLKEEAEKASRFYGFSSLTEALEALIQKLSNKQLILQDEEYVVKLSKRAANRYNKLFDDIKSGKEKVYKAKNVEDFIVQLRKA